MTYRVPERLDDDDPRRRRQVQPQTTAPQTAQQDSNFLILAQSSEALLAGVVLHAAVVSRKLEPFVVEERLYQVEHRRELGEDDELVLLHLGLQDLDEFPYLGRSDALVGL